MPGGRPKNDWKPSRERRLVRLYILSNLNFDEIQKVLMTKGFYPSTSDMQKRLRSLLPRDYTRDYRRYRPSSQANARKRLFHVNYSTKDRVRKCGNPILQEQKALKDGVHHEAVPSGPEISSGLPTLTPVHEQYVSMKWLDLSTDHPNRGGTMERHLPQLIQSSPTSQDNVSSGIPLGPLKIVKPSSTSILTYRKSPQDPEIPIKNGHFTFPKFASLDAEKSSDSLSIHSLGKRLANRFSQSSIEHVASILRSSRTISRRSSLLSIFSFSNSTISGTSSINKNLLPPEDTKVKENSKGTAFRTIRISPRSRKISLKLTHDEQSIWDDLVDESQLAPPSREIPSYPEISLLERACCGMTALQSCKTCGFSNVHRWAITTVKGPVTQVQFPASFSTDFVHSRDYFGNQPLHFVAANASGTISTAWRTIRWLVYKGADIRARNTSGETFMHVLHSGRLKDTQEYLDLLQLLAEHRFPFAQSDYHGRTLSNLFFANARPQRTPIEVWKAIFSQLESGIHDWKKFYRLCDEVAIRKGFDQGERSAREKLWDSLPSQDHKTKQPFRGIMHSNSTNFAIIAKTLDSNGDSALIRIVKEWAPIEDERQLASMISNLIKSGADINMRDRHGDTALAIAARRGLRPAVMALLSHGANPNTRNYRGVGILAQAREYLRPAKYSKKAALYARILSCMALLTDHGVKEEPNTYDEFMSPTTLAQVHLSTG